MAPPGLRHLSPAPLRAALPTLVVQVPRAARCRRASASAARLALKRARPSSPRMSSMNSLTSRPRSPIRPTTIASASAPPTIMSISTDLPTPDPAMMPTRWPIPMVVSALSERMPVSKGSETLVRSSAPVRQPPAGHSRVA